MRVAAQEPARMADLAGTEGLLRAQLLLGTEVVDTWEAPAETLSRSREAPPILVALPAAEGETSRALELVFGIPAQMYEEFLALRAAIEKEQQIDRVFGLLVPRFLRQYLLLVLAILAVAPLGGWLVARRVTRRWRACTRRHGRWGRVTCRCGWPPRAGTSSTSWDAPFDRMVAELAQARSRLEYLQKVSAWQE